VGLPFRYTDDELRNMYAGGRANGQARRYARFWAAVFRSGLLPRRWVTLEVPGRNSGAPRRFPLGMATVNGERYLVSMLGEGCNWVANVRAVDGRARLLHGTSGFPLLSGPANAGSSILTPVWEFATYPSPRSVERNRHMARIIVEAVHADGQPRRWALSERIVAENLDSDHYVAQLLERLVWATAHAEALELPSADHVAGRHAQPTIRSHGNDAPRRSRSNPAAGVPAPI